MNVTEVADLARQIRTQVAKAVVGQDTTVDLMLTALFAAGHVLFTDGFHELGTGVVAFRWDLE